jgi:single-strand DNA-binding protein
MSDGIVFVVGAICKEDPVLKFIPSGKAVCNFSIRVPGTKANEKYGREATEAYFLEVAAWEDLAEHIAESMRKGDRVILQGIHTTRTYTPTQGPNEGVEQTIKGFTAWDAALSVLYCTAEVVTTDKAGPAQAEQAAKADAGLVNF